MFVNHIIKTPTCFGHSCLTIFRGPFPVLSAVTTSLLVNAVKLFIWYVVVYCLCVCECLMYLSVGGLVVNQTSHRQVHQALTHIDNIQPHTK